MKKGAKYLIGVMLLLQLGFTGYVWYSRPKNAWLNIQMVYKDFEYKKELQTQLEATQNARKFILDSMEMELKTLQMQLQRASKAEEGMVNLFEAKKEAYFSKKQLFEEDNAAMLKKFDEQIITQLNQYVKDYGEKNHYNYIFGADGSGALMYANKAEDVTEAVKEYVNRRYKGKTE